MAIGAPFGITLVILVTNLVHLGVSLGNLGLILVTFAVKNGHILDFCSGRLFECFPGVKYITNIGHQSVISIPRRETRTQIHSNTKRVGVLDCQRSKSLNMGTIGLVVIGINRMTIGFMVEALMINLGMVLTVGFISVSLNDDDPYHKALQTGIQGW